jgi:hypothetical protein
VKKIIGPFLALLVVAGAVGCGMASSAVNERCLVYGGGIIESKDFKDNLDPGRTNEIIGFGDSTYCYRTDQRSYVSGVDSDPVEVVSQDDVRLLTDYQLFFKLNQDPEVLRRFHENLGVKTDAWTNDGWTAMLAEYFEPQIERALETAALAYPWRDLYASEDTRQQFQNDTVARVKANIREVIGDDYFCGPTYGGPDSECTDFTFTVSKPAPTDPGIVEAVEQEQTAAARTVAQEQENLRVEKQLESERQLVELYGPEGALLREAIKAGGIQFMVIPEGGTVAVPTPTP